MNKNLHRIIFNVARGQRMVVSEAAHNQGKDSSATIDLVTPSASILVMPWLIGSALLMAITLQAHAQIVADTQSPGNQRPTILTDNQGRPQVNIQTPSTAGVSRNTYSRFDVQTQGAVLNNNRHSNPWLAKGEAKVILNEVNSSNPSSINGRITVNGASASVIIANPSGIQLNGASFVNANRTTLTTGTPLIRNGALDGLDVRKGSVEVGPSGIQSSSYMEIISRAAKIAGQIQGSNTGEVRILTGTQNVDYANGQITVLSGTGTKPAIGIDTTALGGMYAGKITLLATEAGVGVRNAGKLQANANGGQIVITADGRLENTGTIDANVASIATTNGHIDNSGVLHGREALLVSAGADFTQKGTGMQQQSTMPSAVSIYAQRDIHLSNGASISSWGSTTSPSTQMPQHGSISLSAGRNINQATSSSISASGYVQLSSENSITITNAHIISGKADTTLLAAQGIQATGSRITGNTVHLETASPFKETSANIAIQGGEINGSHQTAVLASGNLSIDSPDNISISSQNGHVHLQAGKDILFTAGTKSNAAGHFTAKAGSSVQLHGNIGNIPNSEKIVSIKAQKDIFLIGDSLRFLGAEINAGGELNLAANGKLGIYLQALVNQQGTLYEKVQIAAVGDLNISSYNGGINAIGVTASSKNLSVISNGDTHIQAAIAQKSEGMAIVGSSLHSKGNVNIGSIHENGNVRVTASTVQAGQALEIGARKDIQLTTEQEVFTDDLRYAQRTIPSQLTAANVRIHAGRNLTAQAVSLTASKDHIALTAEKGTLSLQDVPDSKAILKANGNLYVHANNAISIATTAQAGSSMAFTSATNSIHANKANLTATDLLSLSSQGSQTHTDGKYQGGALSIYNQSGTLTLNNTQLQTSATRSAATQSISGQLSVESGAGIKANSSTSIHARTDLSIIAGSADITISPSGTPAQGTGLALTADQLKTGRDLSLIARNGKLTLLGSGSISGAPTTKTVELTVPRHLTLGGAAVELQGSKLTSKGNLNITSYTGNILIDGIRTDFASYVPKDHVAQLQKERDEIEKQIGQIKNDKIYVDMLKDYVGHGQRIHFFCYLSNDDNACGLFQKLFTDIEKNIRPYQEKIASLEAAKIDFEKSINVLNVPAKGSKNFGAELVGQNITFSSAQGVALYAANVGASNTLKIESAGNLPANPQASTTEQKKPVGISISGLSDLYEYGTAGSNQHAWAVFSTPSVIKGTNGVTIKAAGTNADSRLVLNDSEIHSSNGQIHLQSLGDMRLESGQEEFYSYSQRSYKTGKWYKRKTVTETQINQNASANPVILSAQGIALQSGGSIDAYATEFLAPKGKISIIAANALSLYAVPEISYSQVDMQKRSSFLGVTYSKGKTTGTREISSQLPARLQAQGANTASGWNTLLQGTQFHTSLAGATIQAGVGANARADARIILEGIQRTVTESRTRESNYVVWQRQTGAGNTVQTMTLPSFQGPTAPVFKGPVLAQIPAGEFKSEVQKLMTQPGMGYLHHLSGRSDVHWQSVKLAYDQWSYKQEGLTPAGAALLAVAVAAVTNGVGSDLLGVSGKFSSVMADAAFGSLAAQASITLVNNQGNIGKTLKELGHSNTVRATLAAMLTAGAMEKVGSLDSIRPLKGSEAFGDKLTFNLVNASGRALTNTAIHGGSLEEALTDALIGGMVDTAHGEVAGKIKGLESEYIAHKLAHALAGCAAGAAAQGKCRDGAIGSAVGEMVAQLMPPANGIAYSPAEEQKILTYSKLVAGTTAAYVGGDAQTAITTAENTVKNNALIPVILGLAWLVDKAWTAYQVSQDIAAIRDGTKTVEQIAQEKGEEYVAAAIIGNVGRYGVKAAKVAGKWVQSKDVPSNIFEKRGNNNITSPDVTLSIRAENFENSIYRLPPGERVSLVKQAADEAAAIHKLQKDKFLSRINNRDVYTSMDGKIYSLDTQHGRFERINKKTGRHEGEFRMFDLKEILDSVDGSGKHDLRVK